ncbi:MAG TPA: DUF2127 domain-containing protein [Myxococcota bacterium]|nr:DUF2127 domain-containing protein [Myxococcota bacterium]
MASPTERRIHQIFTWSLLLKGALALLECAAGIALALVSPEAIVSLIARLTQDEFVEDPNDFVATQLLGMAKDFSVSSRNFYAFYLLSHGIVKLLVVAGLLRNKLWAYPASLVVLGVFIAYQVYRFTYTHSFGLVVLSVFDLLVVFLIWHEYRAQLEERR